MIGDPVKDRRVFLKSLREQIDSLGPADRSITAASHRSKACEVNELEKQIDSVHIAMTNIVGDSGLTYEVILSELIGVQKGSRFISAPTIRNIFAEFMRVRRRL